MANIEVTTTATRFKVSFNDLCSLSGFKKRTFFIEDVNFDLACDDAFVRATVKGEREWLLTWDGEGETMQIDSIDDVAPTSNEDLYNKLVAILN